MNPKNDYFGDNNRINSILLRLRSDIIDWITLIVQRNNKKNRGDYEEKKRRKGEKEGRKRSRRRKSVELRMGLTIPAIP